MCMQIMLKNTRVFLYFPVQAKIISMTSYFPNEANLPVPFSWTLPWCAHHLFPPTSVYLSCPSFMWGWWTEQGCVVMRLVDWTWYPSGNPISPCCSLPLTRSRDTDIHLEIKINSWCLGGDWHGSCYRKIL